MSDVHFPGLEQATRRLGLDAAELAEAMLCRLDTGESYWSALHGVVAETAQRQGLYNGETKARIDSGDIFGHFPMPFPETPGRLVEALEDRRLDILDGLAAVGARLEEERCNAGTGELEQRRARRWRRYATA